MSANIEIPREAVEAAARQIHTSYDKAAPIEQHNAREAAVDVLNAAAPLLVAAALKSAAQFLDDEPDENTCRQFPMYDHEDGCGGRGLSCAAKYLRTLAADLRGETR